MLRSLDMFGFKSFADKTRFEFSTGVTAVVGPNGSGKSNVVDALKWILGDQSAKSLRGKEMTDVIFNGAANRKGSNFAEATLTFDNASGFLDVPGSEVQIGRRLWRSGDSEYLINQQVARLKDVRNLLMGTGVGTAAYCIIEQGRVDQILQANAVTRRTVFEEAAGISRFKSRRAEAQRKLERVEQNLLRLTDIVDEVESQLTGLRSQAAKATRHRELSSQLRDLWVGLAADDYRLLTRDFDQIQSQIARDQDLVDELTDRQRAFEQQIKAAEASVTECDDRLRQFEQIQTGRRERLAAADSTVRHQTARTAELNSELIRLRKQSRVMQSRMLECQAERTHLDTVLSRQRAEYESLENQAAERHQQLDELVERIERERSELESARTALMQRLRESSAISGQLQHNQEQLDNAQAETVQLKQQLQESREGLQQAEAARDNSTLNLEQLAQDQTAARDHLHEIQVELQALLGEQGQFQRTLAELRETRSAWEARQGVLEDLESRQEGLGIGVREILNRAQTSDYAPWTDVLGSVADLLEVDLEQAALLEVALGPRAQLIVVRRMQPMVEYLQKESTRVGGRVGFISLDGHALVGTRGQKPAQAVGTSHLAGPADVNLQGQPGVVARATQLVQVADEVRPVIDQLLADTWIVERLTDAVDLGAQYAGRCRFVTLQGELLESNGLLFAGALHAESGLMSRRSELRRLKSDLSKLDRRIEEEEFRLREMAETVSSTDTRLSEAEQRVADLVRASSEADSRHEVLEENAVRCQDEVKRLAGLHDRVEQRCRELREQLTAGELRARELKQESVRDEATIAETEQLLARDEARVQDFQEQRAQVQAALDQQRERIEDTQYSVQRLQKDFDQRQRELKEAQTRQVQVERKLSETRLHLLNVRGGMAEDEIELDRLSLQLRRLMGERDRLRQERSQLADAEIEVRGQRRDGEDRIHELEIQLGDARHRLSSLESRISEEFSTSLPAAVAAGASAYALLGNAGASPDRSRPHSNSSAADDLNDAGEAANEQVLRQPQSDARREESDQLDERHELDEEEFERIRPQIQSEVESLRRKLKHLGSVSTDSLTNLEDLEQRFEHLSAQLADLSEARDALDEIIRRINTESRRMFTETLESIRGHFQDLYRKLFGGGEGDIVLEDPDDVLECGIEIVARPPGKELRSLSLLSGGEKTMTAVALLLAIFRSRPSPFCILDEVDAALDESNVGRFVNVLKEFQDSTQFIMISHRKPTMAAADVLYGVTMEESGVSKRMSVRFEDIGEDGNFRSRHDADDSQVAA